MKRFKKILFVLDQESLSDEASADRVASLARLNNARVTALMVDEMTFQENLTVKFSAKKEDIKKAIYDQHELELDAYFASQRWAGLEVKTEQPVVKGFIPIIQRVLRDSHDLVIKVDWREQGIAQLAMRLVRKCPCPVWIMKKSVTDFRQVMGAIDVGADYPETAALNDKIVQLTHSLAQRERGEAHYLHVWRLPFEGALRGPRYHVSDQEIDEMKTDLCKERRQAMEQLLERNAIDCQPEQVCLREGFGVEVIKQAIAEFKVDVVVMGSVGRSGIPGLLIGNKAEQLLNVISCSVLTVKPDGFVSPVTLG